MNAYTLIKLLPHIQVGEYSVQELSERSCIGVEGVKKTLTMLSQRGIGSHHGEEVSFGRKDRLLSVAVAVSLGAGLDESSRGLHWKEFEDFTSQVLSAHGYTVQHNLRLRNPRAEIDIFAHKDRGGLAVDCKHWRRTRGEGALRRVAHAQIRRVERLMGSRQRLDAGIEWAVPVLITLYSEDIPIVDGVPVVSIVKLSDFLLNVEGYLDCLTRIY